MSEGLKPCPFCGNAGVFVNKIIDEFWLECEKCAAMGPSSDTEDGAIAAWNTRHQPEDE